MSLVKLLTLPLRLPRPWSTAAGSSMLKGFLYTHLHAQGFSTQGPRSCSLSMRAPVDLLLTSRYMGWGYVLAGNGTDKWRAQSSWQCRCCSATAQPHHP